MRSNVLIAYFREFLLYFVCYSWKCYVISGLRRARLQGIPESGEKIVASGGKNRFKWHRNNDPNFGGNLFCEMKKKARQQQRREM